MTGLADLYPLRPWTTVRDAREDLACFEQEVAKLKGDAWAKYGPDGLDLFQRFDEIRERLTPRLAHESDQRQSAEGFQMTALVDALPTDHEPWSGNEAIRFVEIMKRGRHYAANLRGLRNCTPHDEAIKRARVKALDDGRYVMAHFLARRKALLESWRPSGPAN